MARTMDASMSLRLVADELEKDARRTARDAVEALDTFARGGPLRDFHPGHLRFLTGIVSDCNTLRKIADRRFGRVAEADEHYAVD